MCMFPSYGVPKYEQYISAWESEFRPGTDLCSVQVNIPAESGEMGVLANHVPSIEQLKPGLVEVIEESGGSKQFFCA